MRIIILMLSLIFSLGALAQIDKMTFVGIEDFPLNNVENKGVYSYKDAQTTFFHSVLLSSDEKLTIDKVSVLWEEFIVILENNGVTQDDFMFFIPYGETFDGMEFSFSEQGLIDGYKRTGADKKDVAFGFVLEKDGWEYDFWISKTGIVYNIETVNPITTNFLQASLGFEFEKEN